MSDEMTFPQKVWDIARQIPRGRVTTYGAIAKCIATARSSRMVGWAMNQSGTQFPPVPAHRVVNRNGMLSGKNFFSYPEQMQELLEAEGVEVRNDKVVDFEDLFWEPQLDNS